MAATYVLTCAILVWCAALAALGAVEGTHRDRPSGWFLGRALALGVAASERVGRLRLVGILCAWPPWAALADVLARAGRTRNLSMEPRSWCAAALLCATALALALGLVAWSPLGIVVGVVVVAVSVPLWDSSRRRSFARELADEMPGVFRTLAMALGAGETLLQAVEYVGLHARGHAGRAFSQAAMRMRCGMSAEDALDLLAGELDAPGVELLTTALVIAQRTGSPLRELFQKSARLVERQGELDRLLSVKTAQVRLSVRIVILMPLAMVCVLSVLSPDFRRGMASSAGTGSLVLAALMDGCAVLVIRHLMKEVI